MSGEGEARRNGPRSLLGRVRHAARHPERVYPYARRWARDMRLRLGSRDHVSYYRAVMAHDSAEDPDSAVGSATRDRWLALGEMQFDYLVEHGLKPDDHLLEIGCGNLRAGWRFINYLDRGHYYGVDISPDILLAAQQTLCHYELQDKLPRLSLVNDLKLEFLPSEHFTVIHAHSVFSHCPIEVIDECLANVGRLLQPHGFFDFTFNQTTGREHHVLHEDYYYRVDTLLQLAARHGLNGAFMPDWEERPHRQSKIRLTKPQREPQQE
ncbi:class I SAM-dependent methyltransferase [Salinactinospora qingdaonensis]|uniref:Class I SAM-dependent methyltransferase n=1 Tax=Salinactinospora qingdaonensis TaxID=702744 RepID=A0ABP7FES9_9ACTN